VQPLADVTIDREQTLSYRSGDRSLLIRENCSMTTATQKNRIAQFNNPLGPDELLLQRMHASESISTVFSYELELLSENPNIDLSSLLGQNSTVEVLTINNDVRFFNGFVTQFSYVGNEDNFFLYRATLTPWLWFLTRTSDCRIFQNMTVPGIIEQVFRDFGFTDFNNRLYDTYREWEYCVQYRESGYNFVSRLMEQEGIFYYFLHDKDKHTLVLGDNYSSHSAATGYESIPYFPPGNELNRKRDHLSDWRVSRQIQTGNTVINDFNFTTPKVSLKAQSSMPGNHAHAEYETYDYPGEYKDVSDGENYARILMEAQQAQFESYSASGNVAGLSPGNLFELTDFPRDDQNKEYLILEANCIVENNHYISSNQSDDLDVKTHIVTMDSKVPFRPKRYTPQPIVQGPQTATVVGTGKIHTDEYGRVKVQFHWDRYGKSDESSSCWVRVSQNWAGQEWGWQTVPHVGHEVIVEHLEGDPDRPIITGRVYNETNMPPASLPDKKTQSIWSDHGGNKIIMEGKEGSQTISLYCPTHKTKMVLGNSWSLFSESDFKMDSLADWTTSIRGNMTVDVGGDLTNVFAGWKHSTTLGWTSEFIGGFKTSVVVGATTDIIRGRAMANFKGTKTEVIEGRKFTHDKAKEYSLVGDIKNIKAPTLMQQFKLTQTVAEEYKLTCKSNKDEKIAGEARTEAKEYRLKADEGIISESHSNFIKCRKMETKAEKMQTKADKYRLKADEVKTDAMKVAFNNNTLVIK
jgi:type VI secretion system secreted protein VgrG